MADYTEKSYEQIFSELEKKYQNNVAAAALFWKRDPGDGTYQYGLRVESPSIMKEFIDKVNLGTDPEGFLFFNSINDLDAGHGNYCVSHNTTENTRERAVFVQFFHGGHKSSKNKFYAEFLAKDPNKTVDYTFESKEGHWSTLNIGSANAHVKKYSDTATVEVTVDAIRKIITFDVPENQDGAPVDVWGNLLFKHSDKLDPSAASSYANYNNDRIIFYPNSKSYDFTAVFIPVETAEVGALGSSSEFVVENVKFSDMPK